MIGFRYPSLTDFAESARLARGVLRRRAENTLVVTACARRQSTESQRSCHTCIVLRLTKNGNTWIYVLAMIISGREFQLPQRAVPAFFDNRAAATAISRPFALPKTR
jgi:hypothetical protein